MSQIELWRVFILIFNSFVAGLLAERFGEGDRRSVTIALMVLNLAAVAYGGWRVIAG